MLSGLPSLFASYVQNVTWEGDNNVLCLQVLCQSPLAAIAPVSAIGSNSYETIIAPL